jgi:hypothetical protein
MTKWIVGLLLLANLAIFGWMRWGSMLTVDVDAASVQAALNADKIKLLPPASVSASVLAPAASGVALPLSPLAPLAASAVPAVSAPAKSTKVANCAEWGEFSGDDLVRAKQALAAMKLGDKLSLRTVEQNHGYWVYIPPVKKRAEVEQKIEELKARGVKDYFVVQEKGQWLNAISLGVFKSKEAAQKFRATLHAKEVGPLKMGIRKSKLKFTVFVINGVDTGITDKLSALQKGFSDSELKVLACGN